MRFQISLQINLKANTSLKPNLERIIQKRESNYHHLLNSTSHTEKSNFNNDELIKKMIATKRFRPISLQIETGLTNGSTNVSIKFRFHYDFAVQTSLQWQDKLLRQFLRHWTWDSEICISTTRRWIHDTNMNRPISQSSQCIRQTSHNAPFCYRNVHTCAHFCYKMLHCGIRD